MKHQGYHINMVTIIMLLLSACAPTIGTHDTDKSPPSHHHHVFGVQRVLVLAVSFPNITPPISLREVEIHTLHRTARYFSIVSYGKISIVGDVKGWYSLPHSLDKYRTSPYVKYDPKTSSRIWGLVRDTLNAAEEDVSYENYDLIIIVAGVRTVFQNGLGMRAYCANPGGLLRVGSGEVRMERINTNGGQHFEGGIIVISVNAHPGEIFHDLAHAMGGVRKGKRVIPDLYSFRLYNKALREIVQGVTALPTINTYSKFRAKFTVYMGPWDLMSCHIIDHRQHPGGMSSFTLLRMGWIEDDQVVAMSPGERRVITLGPLSSGKGTLVVKIPVGKQTHYLLENRQKVGIDNLIPASGLLVLQVDESRRDGGGIVRLVDANPKVSDFGCATFGVERNQNPSVNLKKDGAVEVLWQEGKDLTILVTTHPNDSEVRKMAKLARETSAKSGVKEAKDLLMSMGIEQPD